MKKLGLYLHIPFCVQKCKYCAFLSFDRYDKELEGRYIDALFSEIEMQGRRYGDYSVDTVFFGGGTPSILPPESLVGLLECVKKNFNVSDNAEITTESNPGTMTYEALRMYRAAGFNRLSMGVQSFNDDVLSALGRIHTAEIARKTFKQAREAGFDNINLDLMFSVPRLDTAIWDETLSEAIALGPEHLSFYSLQLEEGTEFYRLYKEGKLEIADDETDRLMYRTAVKRLTDAGYRHYEISNAAKPGYGSRHNLKYWSFDEYLGMGLDASSFARNRRFKNPSDFGEYFELFEARKCESGNGGKDSKDRPPLPDETAEENTEADSVFEYVFTGLRKTSGIDLRDFYERFGRPLTAYYPDLAGRVIEWERLGYLERTAEDCESDGADKSDGNDARRRNAATAGAGGRIRLTLSGFDISNQIMSEFAEPTVD